MTRIKTGVYIHIPFCVKKCYYCDFVTFSNKDNYFEAYKNSLITEIRNSNLKDFEIETIFIGGGTPTVLPIHMLCEIITEILSFNLTKNVEITIEANPGTINEDYLRAIYNCGVNRLSIGLQAWQDEHLKKIGRIHTSNMFIDNYNSAIKVGFSNINVDLIFAIPDLTVDEWKETITNITTINPTHISTYSLIIEEGTVFGNKYEKGLLKETDESLDREMYHIAKDMLCKKGYKQYEISNFAKEGLHSRHNKDCWNRKNYLGFGLNSHSLFEGVRYSNTRILNSYTQNINDISAIREHIHVLTLKESMEEFMFLGLRLSEGISIFEFEKQFGKDMFSIYGSVISELIDSKLLILNNGMLRLSDKGLDLANSVFLRFI
jgi:oxygen-independent coproporphyrinogen III oxidase